MKYDTATPYIASYVIVRQGGKVAFLLRSNTSWMNGFWGLASGKVEVGESYIEAGVREAKEEIGITVKTDDLKQVLTMHRREDGNTWVDVFFEAIKWQGEVINAEPHMHNKLAWFDLEKLPENVIPSVGYAFEQMAAGKQYCEYGW